MNLHAIVSPYIGAINPPVIGTLQTSNGYTTGGDGSRTPLYVTIPNVSFQVQALSSGQILHMDSLNVQGVFRSVYLNGNVEGMDRPVGKGGDILTFNRQTWKVVEVAEPWDANGWTRVIVALQNPGT